MKNVIQNLGLCRKAGALVFGFDAVIDAVKNGKAKGILTALDISPKTMKEIKFHAAKFKVEVVHTDEKAEQFEQITGKSTVVVAITDENLFTLFN
ncbi:MAG: ribosomal L7Ae/L30e/S12e/Gadd45 family protein [Oscillospiraceae bacterium]|nr:ribosomal L7Ae/L30e/S12e/Gadd45 family protein [Oscillospiraceae bacterium]